MVKKKLIALSAAAVIGVGTLAFGASSWAKGNHQSGERLVNRATKMLSLDDGQVEALKLLQAEVVETREMMRGGETGFLSTFSEMISADSFDQQRALNLIDERATALQNNAPELVNAAAVFFDGLNSEQKATLVEKMEKMKQRRGKRQSRH